MNNVANDDLLLLSAELEKSVHEVDPVMAGHLGNLRARMSSGEVDQVANLDISAILDPDSLEERAAVAYQRTPAWLAWLEWTRNVLVLVPIALTWYALSVAAQSYQELVTKIPDLISQPFLLLWEQGFPGLTGGARHLTFSGLARWDMGILLVVIAVTVAVHWWKDVLRDGAERQGARLRERFESYLWLLNSRLARERTRQLTQSSGSMDSAVNQFQEHVGGYLQGIQQQQGMLADLVERRRAELTDLGAFSTGLREGTDRLLNYASALGPVYEHLNTSAGELTQHVQQLSQREAELLKALFVISAHSDRLTQAAAAVGGSLRVAVEDVQRISRDQDNKTQTVSSAATDLRDMAAALMEGENGLRQGLVQARESNQQMVTALQTTAGKIVESNQAVAATAGELRQIVASLLQVNSAGVRQADLEQALAESVQQMSAYSGQLVEVLADLSQGNQQIGEFMARAEQQWTWPTYTMPVAQPEPKGFTVARILPWVAVGLALLSNITLWVVLMQVAG